MNENKEIYLFPMFYGQERLWMLDQMQPNSAYDMPQAIEINGELNVGILKKCVVVRTFGTDGAVC